ncbi:MAG: response regulator [Candidatus Zixiibacteriota bacterium]
MKKTMQIALIEDNRFHAILFEQAVREKFPGSRVFVFDTGQKFLPTLKNGKYDLICMDFHLPDINGLDLLALIRVETTDTPVVIITGAGNEQVAVEAMKAGATDYITKTGDYSETIPRVIRQSYKKQKLIIKNRRLEAKARAAEKLETITTMTSTLNHEINNPLMAILGTVELLLENRDSYSPDLQKKLDMIMNSARRIQSITRQMANLTTTATTETPVGPMIKLEHPDVSSERHIDTPHEQTVDKTN